MSHTLDSVDDLSNDPRGPFGQLGLMLRQGRSFSGRERNCCFLNTRGVRFANISAISGFDFPDDARAAAIVDWDQDGDLDLWVSNRNAPRLRLLRNDTPHANHFLSLRLQGNGTTTNRDAIGARVEVVLAGAGGAEHGAGSRGHGAGSRGHGAGSRGHGAGSNGHGAGSRGQGAGNEAPDSPLATRHSALIKTLRAGEGYLSQRSKWIHFGLGQVVDIERVIVVWPGGDTELFEDVQADGRYHLVQGSGRAEPLPTTERDMILRPSRQEIPPQSGNARIPLATPLIMPPLIYQSFGGNSRVFQVGGGKPVLLSLWASWCAPCFAELKQLRDRYSELRAAGIEIVALSVDGLGEDASDSATAARFFANLNAPFAGGSARPELLEIIQLVHNLVVPMHRSLPLPTSFLIDGEGRLVVIYKGPVTVDQALADVQLEFGTYNQRFERAAAVAGRMIEHPVVSRLAKISQSHTHYEHALLMRQVGLPDLAMQSYRAALQINPEFGEAHFNLGYLYLRSGNRQQAKAHFEQAVRVKSDSARAHCFLGIVLEEEKNFPDAVRHLQRALEIQPDYDLAIEHLESAKAQQEASSRSRDNSS